MGARHSMWGFSGVPLAVVLLFGTSAASAGTMAVLSRFPANGAVGVCADTRLSITFATTPIVATSGNLQIRKASDGSLLWQLNLQLLPNPPVASGWPYQINLNGKSVNYQPFAVSVNTLDVQMPIRLQTSHHLPVETE